MTDIAKYDPAAFSVDELVSTAQGFGTAVSPQLAVTLLRAKLGEKSLPTLSMLARDDKTDRRARAAATHELHAFAAARPLLNELKESHDSLVADAAVRAIELAEG